VSAPRRLTRVWLTVVFKSNRHESVTLIVEPGPGETLRLLLPDLDSVGWWEVTDAEGKVWRFAKSEIRYVHAKGNA
jgi:hypothetical protein